MQLTKKVLEELFKKSERFLPVLLRENSFRLAQAKPAPSSGRYAP